MTKISFRSGPRTNGNVDLEQWQSERYNPIKLWMRFNQALGCGDNKKQWSLLPAKQQLSWRYDLNVNARE